MKNWFNKKYGWFFTNGNKKDPYYPPIDGMDAVSIALHDAKQVGLDTEVVTWALMYMKNNPNLTISEAITMGYFEWVK